MLLIEDQRLTPALLRSIDQIRNYWRNVGLYLFDSNKSKALEGMRLAYKAAGLNPPKLVIWLGSPRAAATAVRLLNSNLEWPVSLAPDQREVWDHVWKQSIRQVEAIVGVDRWKEVRRQIKAEAEQIGWKKHGRYIEKSVKDDFGEKLGIWLWRYLRQNAGASTYGAVKVDIEQRVRADVEKQASPKLLDEVYQELVPPIRQQVWNGIGEPVRLMIAANNGILAGRLALECGFGHLDADWLAYYQYLASVGIKGTEPLEGIKMLSENCGWWWPYENICFLTARPIELHRDNRGLLHNDKGMSIRYPDGWGFYTWHGILVPEYVIMQYEPITVDMIHEERNIEVRRVLIERFGLENYLRRGSVLKIHQDKTGTLYSMGMRNDEPIYVVHVINSTPEPDGTYNQYFLRVPPTMKRAREAVAWTFGLTEDEYMPLAES